MTVDLLELQSLTETDRPITYGVVKPGVEDPEKGVLFVRGGDIADGSIDINVLRTITQEVSAPYARTILRGGEVVISLVGNPGAVAVVPDSLAGANLARQVGLIALRPEYHAPYVKYYLMSPQGKAELFQRTQGAVQQVINLADLKKIKVRVLPKPEQERIAGVLSAYDDLIENNRRRIALLEQSARLLYREWFVHLRFPGHEHVKVVDGVPEGWAINSIAEMFDTTSGGTPSRSVPEYFVGDINWVKTQELDELFIFDTEEHISEAALKNSAAKLFPGGTLLVSIYGGTNIGRTGLLAKAAASNQACVALMPKRHPDDVLFAQKWLQENRGHMVGLGQGAAQTNISQQTLRSQKMLVPTVELLDEFVGAIKPMYQQIANICQQNAKLRDARDLLLPRLMSGDLLV